MINFGQLSRRFIPPSTNSFNRNKLNDIYNQQIPQPTVPNTQRVNPFTEDPETNQQPQNDFMSQYAALNKNRPNRLAYQQAIEQGSPEIKRSGWMKLLSTAGAGADAFGGSNVGDAVNTAVSAYQQPQIRVNDAYKQKVAGLGNLANMEDSDMQDKLKMLEMQYNDKFRQSAEKRAQNAEGRADAESSRQDIELQLRRNQDIRAGNLSDLQIKELVDKLEHSGEEKVTDPNSGITVIRDRKGNIVTSLGKTKLTPGEENKYSAQKAGGDEAAKRAAGQQYDIADDMRKIQGQIDLEGVRGDNRSALEEQKKETAVAKIREKAATMPKGVAQNVTLDLADEIAKGNLPQDASQYLHFDENGVPTISGGMMGSSATEVAMRDWLARSISKNRSGASPNTGTTPNSGTTKSGGKYNITPIK